MGTIGPMCKLHKAALMSNPGRPTWLWCIRTRGDHRPHEQDLQYSIGCMALATTGLWCIGT